MFKQSLLILIFFSVIGQTNAQSAHSLLRSGDKSYTEKDFSAAEEEYRKALEEKKSVNGSYNLGNAIYEQERYEEAIKHFEDAAALAKDSDIRSQAYHNLGNSYMNAQQFDKSVDAYKNALRLSPKDIETKKNLALAQRQLQMQEQQQQQQQQNSDENQDENQEQQENKEQQQQQENQDQQENQENQDQQQQEQQQENQEQQDQQEGQESQEKDLSKEEARKLLQIMEEEERKVQEKLKKAQTQPNKSDKDW